MLTHIKSSIIEIDPDVEVVLITGGRRQGDKGMTK